MSPPPESRLGSQDRLVGRVDSSGIFRDGGPSLGMWEAVAGSQLNDGATIMNLSLNSSNSQDGHQMPGCRPWVKKSKAEPMPETRAPMAGRGSPEAVSRPFQAPSGQAEEGFGIQPPLSPLLLSPTATESHHHFIFLPCYCKSLRTPEEYYCPRTFPLAFPSADLECSLLDLYTAGSFRSSFRSFLGEGGFPVHSI